jgi:hypothetical protein
MIKRQYMGVRINKKQFINKRLTYLKSNLNRGLSRSIILTYTEKVSLEQASGATELEKWTKLVLKHCFFQN